MSIAEAPLVKAAEAPKRRQPRTVSRLLVVDDDTVHRMVIARIGRQVGHEVVEAASYAEAARILRTEVFDCVTLDLTLGDGDGSDILRLMALDGFPGAVMVISAADGFGRSEAKSIARALGVNVVRSFPKPLDLTALRMALASAHALGSRATPRAS